MPLTPEDVSNKRFTPVRLREGYDMGEVDQFLDEVESELARLTRENEELRGRLSGGTDEVTPERAEEPATTERPQEPAATEPVTPERAEQPVAAVETLRVSTVSEASSAAVRLLEIATRNADELVSEARQQAEAIVGAARSSSDQLEADARERAQTLEADTEQRRRQLFGELDAEKQRLDGEVENLRAFEREYRARLKSYFEQQLAALDGSGDGIRSADDGRPQSPSLLGDDGHGDRT